MSASTTGISGVWMVQAGLVFLFGALAIFVKEKSWGKEIFPLAVISMIGLFIWGFSNGMWHAHPLGAIISIVGGGWVIYRITRDKKYEADNSREPLIQKFSQKLPPNIRQHVKWVSVPLGILLALWLSKSILIAFVVGLGITAFFDREFIKTKGINRIATLLLLYLIGFFILLVVAFKVDVAYNWGDFKFFTHDSYILLRGVMEGL